MNRRAFSARLAALAAAAAGGCAAPPRSIAPLEPPPIVQRAPGWCAPASLARCLAAEGFEADQAKLARLGGCTPDGGVDVSSFCRSLKVYLALRGLALVPLVETSGPDALALAARYDEAAAARGLPPLRRDASKTGGVIVLDSLFAGADPAAMRAASIRRKPRFLRAVSRALSGGRPALWGVVLGIVPEPESAGMAQSGGHVRLITGYDESSHRIFYSDPWGPRCETKSMAEDDACAITMSLWALEDGPGEAVVKRTNPAVRGGATKKVP